MTDGELIDLLRRVEAVNGRKLPVPSKGRLRYPPTCFKYWVTGNVLDSMTEAEREALGKEWDEAEKKRGAA